MLSTIVLGLHAVATVTAPARASTDEALWSALRDGRAMAMIRHALAPGFGDPDTFKLFDCTTQRNLSREGHEQARRIGDLFRRNGIDAADVYTSQWCRSRQTAEGLGLGDPRDLPALNSFFGKPALRRPQTTMLGSWLATKEVRRPLVLVTHQVNISAFAGRAAGSGEIVVVTLSEGAGRKVLGSIPTQHLK